MRINFFKFSTGNSQKDLGEARETISSKFPQAILKNI
jgi:hypothetical protein